MNLGKCRITGWPVVLTLILTTGCQHTPAPAKATTIPTSTQPASHSQAADTRKLQPGDCLLVTFHRKTLTQPITERVIVDAAGDITLPLAGKVRMSGLTVEEAENTITSHYQSPPYGDKIRVKANWCE